MNKQLKAAVYGLAIGDALGVPFEFKSRGSFLATNMIGYGTHNQPAGTWSDDTTMTIATCDSIRHCDAINTEDMRSRFRQWMYDDDYTVDQKLFDIGITTADALRNGVGINEFYANGNGSLMRILPLAFVEASEQEIAEVSAITHAHTISKDICIEYVKIARALIKGQSLKEAIANCSGRIPTIAQLDEAKIKSSGYVVDTFEAAIWALATTTTYEEALLKAINLGEDTDTVGAVTGGLVGIIYGLEGIPEKWVDNLRGKELINRCLF